MAVIKDDDLTVAYAKGIYDEKEVWKTKIAKIKDEILKKYFSVVNPMNTFAYINVVSLEDIETIIHKYTKEQNNGS